MDLLQLLCHAIRFILNFCIEALFLLKNWVILAQLIIT